MTYRANAANPGGNSRHFPEGPPFAKFLKAPKFGDVKPGGGHFTLIIEIDRNFGMPLNPRDGVNDNSVGHGRNILAVLEGNFRDLRLNHIPFAETFSVGGWQCQSICLASSYCRSPSMPLKKGEFSAREWLVPFF